MEAQLEFRTKEAEEFRQQQRATAEILKVINTSKGDLGPVFDIILEKAHSLCDVTSGSLQLLDGDKLRAVAVRGMTGAFEKFLRQGFQISDRLRQSIQPRKPIETADMAEALSRIADEPGLRAAVELGRIRTTLSVALAKDDVVLGRIVAARKEVRPFTGEQIALLQSFADQAVMAIENARLLAQQREAIEQQAASAEILRTIASAPSDAEQSLQRIAETTARLFSANSVTIRIAEGDEWTRTIRVGAGSKRIGSLPAAQLGAKARNLPRTVFRENRQIHIPDLDNVDPTMTDWPMMTARAEGTRTISGTPLRREDKAIGALIVYRDRLAPFTVAELALQQSFADQAVIAIENARLFNETEEALERQTATSDILKVIASSPSDVQPVFDAIAESARRVIGGHSSLVTRVVDDQLHLAAFTTGSEAGREKLTNTYPQPFSSPIMSAQVARTGQVVFYTDTEKDADDITRDFARARGYRSVLAVPMLRNGTAIGTINVTRAEPGEFDENTIGLLKTFADQAVIAIENARLFSDTKEALERQIATSEVLQVISSSPGELEPVFRTMLTSAMRLCEASHGVVWLREGDGFRSAALHGPWPDGFVAQWRNGTLVRPGADAPISRAAVTGKAVQTADLRDSPAYRSGDPLPVAAVDVAGIRTVLSVPMFRDAECVGAIALSRREVRLFTDKQIDLVASFAKQAAIAIENARLLNETREALERQSATADILNVIASSPDDVQPVFQAIADRSNRLVNGLSTTVFKLVEGVLHLVAFTATNPAADTALKGMFPTPLSAWSWNTTLLHGKIYRVPDTENEVERLRDLARLRGYRSMLFVPLLRDGEPIGMIGQTRREPGPFTDHHVQLLQTFADQAVIAISNVALFNEVQERTRELSASLDDLRAAQDRLVQTEKLASLGQLTAGIAHEIKNPLNFVNNFSALSAELIDELDETLLPAPLDQKMRGDVSELTQMLKSNLEKVVQHGKRADSIVKNMLLHSREGSGEHRSADINALVEESLNLAYHGARAEKPGFNITLKRSLDPDAGEVELYPQEITRALLNLISNGFYAATKRKSEGGEETFEPVLSAATRNVGDRVEIRIRDNGTGIPPEVKEKLFNPFFTTKPAGEGTGLGLSMTHDIVVKQHGGRIDIETEPGQFTEFTIVLPRKSSNSNEIRGKA